MPGTSIVRSSGRRSTCVVDAVELDLEQVGQDAHHRRPHHLEREVEQHQRQLVHRATEADHLAHDVGLVVERVVEELLHPDLLDAGADAAHQDGEDVERPARVDAGDEHRRVAVGAGPLDHVEQAAGALAGCSSG